MSELYNNPDLFIACCSCEIYKHFSYCRFKTEKYRLLTYQQRYKFRQTKDTFGEHSIKCKIEQIKVVKKKMPCARCAVGKKGPWASAKPYLLLLLRP